MLNLARLIYRHGFTLFRSRVEQTRTDLAQVHASPEAIVRSIHVSRDRLATALFILALAVLSTVFINPYQYGVSDHSIALPFLKSVLDPSLYPGDLLVAQRTNYPTYLYYGLGLLSKYLGIGLPTLFFGLYFLALCLTLLGLYLIAIKLFNRRDVAYLALFFFLVARLDFASIPALHTNLYPRTVVLPVLLFALYYFFDEKYLLAFGLAGFAFLIHALSAVYVVTMLLAGSLVKVKGVGTGRLLACIGLLTILASPTLYWKLSTVSGADTSLFYVSPEWLKVMRLRSSHHVFPFSFGITQLTSMSLVMGLFLLSWKHHPQADYHRIVVAFSLALGATTVAGVVFSELIPVYIAIQLQLLRSLLFITYFAIIYVANYFLIELQQRERLIGKLAVTLPLVGLFVYTSIWLLLFWCVALVALVSAWFLIGRNRPQTDLSSRQVALSLVGLLSAVAIWIVFFRGFHFDIQNAQDADWIDVQLWARENTSPEALFIVPPWLQGFRVESERAVYGEWKDGTLAFFNPAFGSEWLRRMAALGYVEGQPFGERYERLTEADFESIVADTDYTRTYAVVFREHRDLGFPLVYRNDEFIVYEVRQD